MNTRILIFLLFLAACGTKTQAPVEMPDLPQPMGENLDFLYHFAYHCIDQEYPNKTGHVMGDSSSLMTPSEMHPAFYGCFDWHSSVHGHWTLVKILTVDPDFQHKEPILEKLRANINAENIKKEVAYFDDPNNSNFERTYGWAWLLKLDEALHQWDHPDAQQMADDLAPLTELIEKKYIEFLNKLDYPIRVGEHPNTAFGLSFALDYARSMGRTEFEQKIVSRAREYYMNDQACPMSWEPGGFDFLSPCLQEASLMQKILSDEEFNAWISEFLPGFMNDPSSLLTPAKVSDRSDGKIAHLDGLNFSRAWCLYEIGLATDNAAVLKSANDHFNYSFDKIDSDQYAGSHWLASFAMYALLKAGDQ